MQPNPGIVSSITLEQIRRESGWPTIGDSAIVFLICAAFAMAILKLFARTGR